MENTKRDYYEIPTTDGNFYLYREYTNHGYNPELGTNDIKYNDFIEFFTGTSCGEHIDNELLDLKKERDALKFECIKDELSNHNINIEHVLSHTNVINYKYLSFYGCYDSTKYGFEYLPKYQLFRGRANFIIKHSQNDSNTSKKYLNQILNYHKISSVEFSKKVKELINKYGSIEAVRETILERMRNKAMESIKLEEYINNKLRENKEEKVYIKKY